MRVYLGADHAGYELKQAIIEHLRSTGHEPVDCGAFSYDADDDYPAFCIAAAEKTVADPGSLGIVLGGSGNGEQIAANKVPGARCALAWSTETASLAREHNNAQLTSKGPPFHETNSYFAHSRRGVGLHRLKPNHFETPRASRLRRSHIGNHSFAEASRRGFRFQRQEKKDGG